MNERNTKKISILLKQDKKVFHMADLMLLWDSTNQASLRRTVSRYVQKGILIKIYRGFYSVVPISQIDPLELGSCALHSYCYVSTETVLVQAGVMFQQVEAYTYCSSKTKRIHIAGQTFKSRQLAERYLYNTVGIIDEKRYKIASPERAIADMLYFNPHAYFDAKDTIDWKKVKAIQKEVGYL